LLVHFHNSCAGAIKELTLLAAALKSLGTGLLWAKPLSFPAQIPEKQVAGASPAGIKGRANA
jgi:hypothetical protein